MLRCPKVTGRRTSGRLKLIVWHFEAVERLDGQDVKPCATVDQGLGDLYVVDDG